MNRSNSTRRVKSGRPLNRVNLPIKKIVSLYQSGHSENELSKMYKTSRNVIRTRLLEEGVKIRNQSEAEKMKWSRMTAAQRIRQVEDAHRASRGRRVSMDSLRQMALAKQRSMGKVGIGEKEVGDFLKSRGFSVSRQYAWGPYNFDFMIGEAIAVELNIGTTNPLGRINDRKKIEEVVRAGKTIVYLCVKDFQHLRIEALEELVRRLHLLSRNPSPSGQYWMIRSYRNTFTGYACDFHDLASIETLPPRGHFRGE